MKSVSLRIEFFTNLQRMKSIQCNNLTYMQLYAHFAAHYNQIYCQML